MVNPENLNEKQKGALRAAFKNSLESRRSDAPAEYFPWHEIQEWVLEVPGQIDNPVRVILIVGGNRSGKSKVAQGMMSEILRRESPLNDQFLTTDKYSGRIRQKNDSDPLRIWVVPPTGEKFREDWVNPADSKGIRYWMGDRYIDHRQSPDYVFLGKPPGMSEEEMQDPVTGKLDETKCDRILGKSQDQDLMTFEASEVDVALFDEEPPNPDIVTSTAMRIATSNGVLIFAFTPLRGLSWSYERWWKPLVKQGRATKVADRRWVHVPEEDDMGAVVACQMGMADNPLARTYAKEILQDPTRTDAEKEARVYGEYGFVEGALIEKVAGIDLVSPSPEHASYVVDQLPDHDQISKWYMVADPNKSYGCVLSCIDNDGNLFFVSEHLEEGWPNRKHAEEFKRMEKKYVSGPIERYADPGSAGSQSIIDLEDFGLAFEAVEKGAGSVSRSIKRLRGLAWEDPDHVHPITGEKGAPRMYFYAPGLISAREEQGMTIVASELAEQMSQARQKEDAAPDTPDKTSKTKLDLFDCARYTADLAMATGPTNVNDKVPSKRSQDRLPDHAALRAMDEETDWDPSEERIYTPEYDFR